MLSRTLIPAVGCLLLLGASSRAGVTIVDPQGGPGVAMLQAAIDQAVDGDVLLLRPGTYFDDTSPYFLVVDKGLTIEPDKDVGRLVTNGILINPSAGQKSVLRGLQIGRPDGPNHALDTFAGLVVVAVDEFVWVEDCTIYGFKGWAPVAGMGSQPGGAAVDAYGSASGVIGNGGATFVRCTLTGGAGFDEIPGSKFGNRGGPALFASNASMVLHDCILTGGRAGDGENFTGNPTSAGQGALVLDNPGKHSVLLLSGCTVNGGAECNGPVAGVSGDGLECDDALANLSVRDSSFAAGAVVGIGASGLPIDVTGPLETFPEPAKGLELPPLLGSGESGVIRVAGEQGDAVLLLVSAGPGYHNAQFKQGVLSVDLASLVRPIPLAVLSDPSGELDIPFHMPALPAGIDHLLLVMQAAFTQGGVLTLGDGSALFWFDG